MRRPSALDPLTNSQLNICIYGGGLGVLIALTCFIQLMLVGYENWRVAFLLSVYVIAGTSYLFLALQKHFAPLLLIISAVLVMIANLMWILSLAFSFVVVLLLIYSIIIAGVVYTERIPPELKKRKQALDAEEANWNGKI